MKNYNVDDMFIAPLRVVRVIIIWIWITVFTIFGLSLLLDLLAIGYAFLHRPVLVQRVWNNFPGNILEMGLLVDAVVFWIGFFLSVLAAPLVVLPWVLHNIYRRFQS